MHRLLQMVIKSFVPAQPRKERLNNAVATALLFRQVRATQALQCWLQKKHNSLYGTQATDKKYEVLKVSKNTNLIKNVKKLGTPLQAIWQSKPLKPYKYLET